MIKMNSCYWLVCIWANRHSGCPSMTTKIQSILDDHTQSTPIIELGQWQKHAVKWPNPQLNVEAISIKLCNYSPMCECFHFFSCFYNSRQIVLWSFDVWEPTRAHRVHLVTWLDFPIERVLILFSFHQHPRNNKIPFSTLPFIMHLNSISINFHGQYSNILIAKSHNYYQ